MHMHSPRSESHEHHHNHGQRDSHSHIHEHGPFKIYDNEHSHDVKFSDEFVRSSVKALWVAFGIKALLTVAEVIGGMYANSLSLIADALHNLGDAGALVIALVAFEISTKKSNKRFSFGYRRAETIGAFVNTIFLIGMGAYIAIEAVIRAFNPVEIEGLIIIYVSIIALIIDLATTFLVYRLSHTSMNMRSAFIHNLSDALGSLGVIIAGLAVIYYGWDFVDTVISLMIAAYMIVQGCMMFPKITRILMNASPDEIDADIICPKIMETKGVLDVHHVHTWEINEGEYGMECHVVTDGNSDEIKENIKKMLATEFNICHATIETETPKNGSCSKDKNACGA